MTPAINLLKKKKIPFKVLQYEHEPSAAGFANEAAIKLDLLPQKVFKTLVVELDSGLNAVALLPSTSMLSMKKMAKACGAKKAKMATEQQVQNATGYVLGGVSPFGQKKLLTTIIDNSAQEHDVIYVSGGKRGLEIVISPQHIGRLVRGKFEPITVDQHT